MKHSRLFIYCRAFVLFFGILISMNTSAQLVSSYTFTQSAGAYTTISAGTVLGDTSNDDNNFTALNIGFTFYYNGTAYTTFGVNSNGYIGFGNLSGNGTHTVISSNNTNNVISAMNFDLQARTGADLQYQTTGSAPNRTLVVQWRNYRTYNLIAATDTMNFQIRINETSNTIVVKYGFCAGKTAQTSQTGLKGASNTDFNNRYVSDTVNTWLTSTAGAANNATCVFNAGFVPGTGLTYTWTPPAPPAAPTTLTFTNITTTGMTLNWVDNSTSEINFQVWKSTDNITYTQINTTPSTSTATTGTLYSLAQSGMISGTLYYFKIYAVGTTPSTALSGSATTLAGTICGTKKIGPTGDYTYIKQAIAALLANGLSCPVVLELQAAYVSSVDTFPIVVPFLGCNNTRTLTLRPETGATNLILIGDSSRIIDLNGATWFTIDGRAGGTGTAINLTIYDSLTTNNSNTIRFINDAQNNTLTYLNIQGATKGATTNGVIQFGNAATTAGNSNNTITHCDITKSDSMPQVLIYSNTTNGTNSSNTITNNNFHDWFSTAGTNYGINISTNNATWTISNNNFYQSSPCVFTGNTTVTMINIAGGGGPGGGASGNGFIVDGNFIGGSAAACGGGAWTTSGGGSRFTGISMSVGTTTASEIQGNTIRNFNISTAATGGGGGGASILTGINIAGGNINVGNTTPNNIGSGSSNNSIQTFASGTGTQVIGISSASSGTVAITGNIIGGINANDSAGIASTSVIGITNSAGTVSITNNSIGSASQANSMVNASSSGSGIGTTQVTGITSSNSTACTISGNAIRNLSNQYLGANTSYVRGISTSGGVNTITSNTIEFLSNTAPQSGTNGNASVLGISQSSNTSGQTVSGNVIRSLSNKSDSGNVVVTGIYYAGSTTGTNVIEKNKIYRLSATLDTAAATINGIQVNGGHSTIDNNMISLGTDTTNSSYTGANEYNGILKTTTGSNNFYFNSVSISGTGVGSRVTDTYAFRRTATGTDTLRNNIFASSRSNATTGGSHYSIALNNDTNVTSGKNDLWGTGTGYLTGLLNTTQANSLFGWFSISAVDSNSFSLNPNFQSANNLHINITNPSGIESKGYTIPGISNDIDGDVRPGPAGSTHGGGTAPDLGADEFDGTPVNLDMGIYSLVKPTNGCHTASDSVIVGIKNFSTQTINFATNPLTLTSSASGVNPVTFAVVTINTGTLAAGATKNVVVSTAYNMSATGTYIFNAYTVTTGDLFPNNDTLAPVSITIAAGTTAPSFSSICSGSPIVLTVSGQTTGSTIQWQQSTNHTTWTNVAAGTLSTVTVSPTVTTYYRNVSCGLLNSNIDTVVVTSVSNPVPTGATRCGTGPVTVHATSANEILWYDSASNGNLLDTGTTYTSVVSASRAYYAAAFGNVSAAKTLQSTLVGGRNAGGIMFTITALNNINITGFDTQADTGIKTFQIYYRRDNMNNVAGSNTNATGWIFVDSVTNITGMGAGVVTTIPISMSVLVPAGKTYSFYVLTSSGGNVTYSNGTVLGAANTTNADLQINDGYAGGFFACITQPRVFNGIVHYKSGCVSNRVAANVTVTAPPAVHASASSATLCGGDSVSLHATSTNANYHYTWTPTSGLNDSIGATVYTFPTSTSVFYVLAHDSITQCGATDSVKVIAYPHPAINANANPNDTVCAGDSVYLSVNLPLSYSIGTNNTSNNSTSFPAPYGNSSFGARHQMLISADEMLAAGMVPGYINSLSFNVSNANGSGPLVNFTISIAATALTALTNTFQTSAMTTVFTSASYTPVNGINTHIFTAPFHWNGTSNILIQTCFNDTSSTVNARMRQSPTTFLSCTYFHADVSNNCSTLIGDTVVPLRPNIRFGIRNQYKVRWISSQHVSDSSSATPYTIPTSSDVFNVTVTDTITGCITKDSVSITVDPAPTVNLGHDTTACGQIILDAGNAGDDYLWSDSSTSQTLTADTTGIYAVRVTHLSSCSNSDSINIVINPIPTVALALPYDSVCTGDGTRVLSGGTPANGIYSGTGVTGTNFDPVAAGAGYHTIVYTYTDASTQCSNTASDSIRVDICAGITELSSDGLVKVYPNPFSKDLSLDLGKLKDKCVIELVTPEAKVIATYVYKGGAVYPISIDNVTSGVYFLKITSTTTNYVIRLVKQD